MRALVVLAVSAGLAATSSAWAQGMPERPSEESVPAPSGALEITLGTGYTQGFGLIRGQPIDPYLGNSVPDVTGAGIGFDLGLGYRIAPHFSFEVGAQYQELTSGSQLDLGDSPRGLAMSVGGTLHLAPYARSDPWLSLFSGYRFLWIIRDRAPSVTTEALRLGGIAIGLEFRAAPGLALGPMASGELDMFVRQDGAAIDSSDRELSAFVSAGVRGRFDVLGSSVPQVRNVVSSR